MEAGISNPGKTMKYNQDLIEAFMYGWNARAKTASVTNGIYYSYDTPIARKDGVTVYVDMDYYSNTTSRQRNELIRECKRSGFTVIELVGTRILP